LTVSILKEETFVAEDTLQPSQTVAEVEEWQGKFSLREDCA
jgi:hypothetical protein